MSKSDRPRWTPSGTTAQTVCQNCNTAATRQFVRVFGDSSDTLWHCPDCEEPNICARDLKQGAGANPDYDPAVDRGETSDNHPIFPQRGDDS